MGSGVEFTWHRILRKKNFRKKKLGKISRKNSEKPEHELDFVWLISRAYKQGVYFPFPISLRFSAAPRPCPYIDAFHHQN